MYPIFPYSRDNLIRAMSLYILMPILVLNHLFVEAQSHTNFLFNSFNSSTLDELEHSTIRSGAICLTNQSQRISGRVLYPHPIQMKQPTLKNGCSSFSTTFVFAILPFNEDTSRSGHGMAFFMTPNNSTVENSSTEFLGLLNVSINERPQNHLFAVEFDTVESSSVEDIDGNHVGVDLNNLKSIKSQPAGYWINDNNMYPLDLSSGKNIQAWIDYDDAQQQLNVTIVEAGSIRPKKPLLSLQNLNLSDILTEEMYVGFSAATGSVAADHCVLAWSFSTNGSAAELDVSHLRSLIREKKSNKGVIAGITTSVLVVLVLLIAAAVFTWKRNKYRDIREEWEMEYWPQRFKYRDLHIATKGFREDQVVGSGGFGQVYKGVLPSSGQEVAVKSIFRETTEGMKEFIAEISSLGRLQHRNLVQIRGYCRREAKLFIVYDYMPNGSLEKMLFDQKKMKNLLTWAQRYKILRDVGEGLLYLHEGWEKIVVHRDIKSSNVLLNFEFNAKLGDFGLARLYEHAENPRTTRVMGTLGYIAPEVVHTGKVAPSSDVFSYGILMLEVACGRRPVDPSLDASEIVMVDWVRKLYSEGKLMDAADPNLGGEYVEDEMEKVLKLGLWCCKLRPEMRPSVRQVLQIIEGEVGLPSSDVYEMSRGRRDSFGSTGFSFASTSTSPEVQLFTSTSISGEGRSFSSGKSQEK